jgi:hypothetical protein
LRQAGDQNGSITVSLVSGPFAGITETVGRLLHD